MKNDIRWYPLDLVTFPKVDFDLFYEAVLYKELFYAFTIYIVTIHHQNSSLPKL